jgi:hypothetical protein
MADAVRGGDESAPGETEDHGPSNLEAIAELDQIVGPPLETEDPVRLVLAPTCARQIEVDELCLVTQPGERRLEDGMVGEARCTVEQDERRVLRQGRSPRRHLEPLHVEEELLVSDTDLHPASRPRTFRGSER